MAQILVVNENFCWYQAVASLDNYYEVEVEERILQHASGVFESYHTFKCKFTFENDTGETSEPDILLISKDFKKWVIVEVELTGKPLKHTRKQLRVFSKPKFVVQDFVKYSIAKCKDLEGKETELTTLFTNQPADVLVIFDSYHKESLATLQQEFGDLKICVFEIYKTNAHALETYRLSGDYPYVDAGYTFLKNSSSYDIYEIQRPGIVSGISTGNFEVLYKMTNYRTLLMNDRDKFYLKIPRNPFSPDKTLILRKTLDNKFLLETVN